MSGKTDFEQRLVELSSLLSHVTLQGPVPRHVLSRVVNVLGTAPVVFADGEWSSDAGGVGGWIVAFTPDVFARVEFVGADSVDPEWRTEGDPHGNVNLVVWPRSSLTHIELPQNDERRENWGQSWHAATLDSTWPQSCPLVLHYEGLGQIELGSRRPHPDLRSFLASIVSDLAGK